MLEVSVGGHDEVWRLWQDPVEKITKHPLGIRSKTIPQGKKIILPLRNKLLLPHPGRDEILDYRTPTYHVSTTTRFELDLITKAQT